MKKRTQPTAWIRTISTGVFVALFAMVLLTLVMPTQAKAVCDVHSWGDWRTVQQPTCTAKGTEQRTCHNCGTSEYRDIPATGHSWGTTRVTLEPTCTMAGKGNHSCQVCKKRESCNIKPLGHDWVTVENTPGTCIRRARTVKQCSRCGEQDITEGAYGTHVWGAWQTITEPTCTAQGMKMRNCTVCPTASERESIPALGHNMVTVATHPATCMNRGYTELKCTRCDYTDTNEGSYGSHVMGEWQTTTQPTCTAAGEKRRTCTVCGKAPEKKTIPALGHDMVTGETVTGTCIREGYTSKKCSRCGHEEKTSTGYASHVMGKWKTTTQPTCTAAGEKQRNCTVCGKAPEKKTIPALGHDMVTGETVTGTCIREGYTSKKCSRCGHEEKTSTGYGAHVWGEWEITIPATCTTEGEHRHMCVVCQVAAEVLEYPALGHNMVPGETVTGTCIREGYTSKKCSRCGYKEKTSTGYGAHVMGEWQTTTQPTCTAAGEKQRNCTVCGKLPEKETIPANGHRWGAWYVKTPAEIGKDGLEERDCQVCGKAETRPIPALAKPAVEPKPKLTIEAWPDHYDEDNMYVGYKVTNTGNVPVQVFVFVAFMPDNVDTRMGTGALLAGDYGTSRYAIVNPGETVTTHLPKGPIEIQDDERTQGYADFQVDCIGKTESGTVIRSNRAAVHFDFDTVPESEETETEPKPELTITAAWPVSWKPHNQGGAVYTYVGYSLKNTGNVPIQVHSSWARSMEGKSYGGYAFRINGQRSRPVLQPGESITDTAFQCISNEELAEGYVDFELCFIGFNLADHNDDVYSNFVPVHFDFDTVPESEETETEPKLVLVKDSSEPSEGSPVHMRQESSYFIRGQATVRWRVINASNEAIWFKWTVGRYPYRGSSMSKNKYHGMTLLPGETSEPFTMLDYINHRTPACPIKGEMSVIENGGEYSTWFSLVCYGVTKSGEEVTSNTVTFNWPVFFDEDPDDSTNDPTIDPEDPTHDPEDPNDPQNMAASLTVVKAEASAPANGQHYVAGEEITFSITYQNVGDKPISSIHVYDALAGFGEIGSTGSLAPDESRTCSFKYRVTAADVNVYGYVANTAFATYQDGGLTRKATSNRVVIILNPDIVPPGILDPENPDDPDNPGLIPTITIGDPEHPFDPEHPEEYDGPFGLPGMQGEDHCELIVKNHATGTTDYDQHSCAAHQSTRTAVQAMTGAAATPAVSLSAWTYARTLWQNDCNVLLEKLYSCANGPAKAIIMEENLAFETMVTMREAALNVLYPDQPEKVAEEIAKLYEDRCTELCYMLHTLPKAKPVEAASTEMFMMSGDGSICRTEITGDTGAGVSYTETLCSQHGMTDMMTGFVLNGTDDLATATKQIGQLWRSELRTEMDIIRGALSDENAAIITYDLGTTRIWLEAHEALLQMLYPKQEAAVTNIINDTIKQRVTTLCEEVNK